MRFGLPGGEDQYIIIGWVIDRLDLCFTRYERLRRAPTAAAAGAATWLGVTASGNPSDHKAIAATTAAAGTAIGRLKFQKRRLVRLGAT